MEFIDSMDPFLMQLVLVPLIAIGLGGLVAYIIKNVFIGPLTTLVLNILYEFWYMKHYYPDSVITLSSWNIIFPVISLVVSWVVVSIRKQEDIYK